MNNRHFVKGFTLIEIIISFALLTIVVIMMLSMFMNANSGIFASGYRTQKTLELTTIVDELVSQNNLQKFDNAGEIVAYLSLKGYNQVLQLSTITQRVGTNDLNFYVSPNSTTALNVEGFQVTVLKFFNNGTRTVQITTFVIRGGGS